MDKQWEHVWIYSFDVMNYTKFLGLLCVSKVLLIIDNWDHGFINEI